MANNVVPDPQPVTLETAAGVATGTAASPLRVDPTGTTTQPVSAASLPLPSGAATLAEQQTQTTSLQLLDDAVYTDGTGTPSKAIAVAGTDGTNPQILKTDASGELQIDVLTSALPSGAATSANQTTEITSLQLIDDIVHTDGAAINKIAAIGGFDGTNIQALKSSVAGALATAINVAGADGRPNTDTCRLVDETGTDRFLEVAPKVFNGTTWDRQRGDATNGTLVNLGANNDVTVTGTVTEANSAAIAASLSVIDDWDETDRAKVNPIVGQAGVAAGAGVVSATTQRVTVATDDVVSVDDNGGSLTVDGTVAATQSGTWTEANSAAIKTAVELIDDAISGNNMMVDVVALTGDVEFDQTAVTAVAAQFTLTAMTGRRTVTFVAPTLNTKVVAIGKTGAVTITSGSVPLGPGAAITLDLDETVNTWWVIAESGTQRICAVQIS